MLKKIKLILLLFCLTIAYNSSPAYTLNNEPVYTQLRIVDKGTFNEYRYKITDSFFSLRNKYELTWKIDIPSARLILDYAKLGYNYLPDSLSNKNYYSYLKTALERGILYPNNSSNFTAIESAIENYLDKTTIQSITWKVQAFPSTWNAPLTVTFRWSISDPTWTVIPKYNHTWWMYQNGRKVVLGNGLSISYTFREEWNFSVFLDVSSAHKNAAWYTDVLSFSSRADVVIKEKVASIILKVNSLNLLNNDLIKFTPEESTYWLLFDATNSTPTSWTKFIKTTWDFWNWIIREREWNPKIERVIYPNEWDYNVTLKLETNELKKVERKFVVSIHNPIATINSSSEEWFLWDKFTFSAQNSTNNNLNYSWEIIDLNKDEVIIRKTGTIFNYTFNEKWKYNVKMSVREPSWDTDTDTKIIYINSRAPVADYLLTIPLSNKPNRVFFDATKSYDPDYSDDWKLKFAWIIDWERVELDFPNSNGSNWYFTFDSVWDHSVVLEVTDPDWIISTKNEKISIKSLLSVDFSIFPRVAQRSNVVRFVVDSPEARFYEWDFWDGVTKSWKEWNISHEYNQSWTFNVKLKVIDAYDKENIHSKNVYIWESEAPFSFLSVLDSNKNEIEFDKTACSWEWAYKVNRVDVVQFSWKDSINVDWKNTWLTYSWKVWNDTYNSSLEFTKKFEELWCFPVKLTVTSENNWKTHSTSSYLSVENLAPTLSTIDIRVQDEKSDPVIINLSATLAKDRDWVIQSYLWYYYTDVDSEPQDFRSTKLSSTTFVLPKVTWNYYFVVIMKDNNETRITSEELNDSKYFITLSGDNVNTPLIKLTTSDSSVAIWDEVTFNTNVENILWQDISQKVKYSWDFDGDGFYDKETTISTTTNKYTTSWEKHAKVKVSYKWFSNTKSVTINVSNILKPDFWYISIWNKFVFFDNSLWSSSSNEWDLGDGTIIKNTDNIVHEYSDNLSSHLVTLKISEWTKVKEVEKKVVKNVKNVISSRKEWLIVFYYPELNDQNEIVLDDPNQQAFLYLWNSAWSANKYVIDFDLSYDSDLNGWTDDDEDNLFLDNYVSTSVSNVKLNDKKFQKVRIFTKNIDNELVDSKDITIVKNYIQEETIDLNSIVFEWVSESVKLKIEKLKELINSLPKEDKLKWMMYVQKLQEWWFDNREKTNIILEFEWFISELWIQNPDEIINLLEWLLVDDQEDKSEKSITFNALKNLIPNTIVCIGSWSTSNNCYEDLVFKLETIRDSENVEENKALWSYILTVIATDSVMTNKEKTDFKAILKTLVYWGVVNIPETEKQEVIIEESSSKSNLLGLLMNILKWVLYIVLWFSGIILIYYIFYLLVNRDKNIWFQDFIIEKTSWWKNSKNVQWKGSPIKDDLEDIFNEPIIKTPELKKEEIKKQEDVSVRSTKSEDVPSWLKWNFNDEELEKKSENLPIVETTKIEEIKPENKEEELLNVKKEDVPDWLKWSFVEEKEKIEEIKPENKEEELLNVKTEDVPDWLKWSFVEEKEIKTENKSKEGIEKVEDIKTDNLEDITKIEEDNIPDWLKWSFSEEKSVKTEIKQDDNIPDWLKTWITTDKTETITNIEEKLEPKIVLESKESEIITKEEPIVSKTKQLKKSEKIVPSTKKKALTDVSKPKPVKNSTKKEESIIEEKKGQELWDDWMKVPDWLKTDTDTDKDDNNSQNK